MRACPRCGGPLVGLYCDGPTIDIRTECEP